MRNMDIIYVGIALATDFTKVVRAACDKSLAFQPEIFAKILSRAGNFDTTREPDTNTTRN
jgi:hypothetical protein